LLPKIGDGEIGHKGTHNRVSEVCPIGRGEKILGEFNSMGEGAIHCHLILDVRKKTNERNVDLDETELSLLVERIPDEPDGLSREIVVDLRYIKILNEKGSWIDGTNGGNGTSLDTANQSFQEVVELENFLRSTCDVRPFGNQTHIGRCGRSTHANGD
jgi:hypothetical protein